MARVIILFLCLLQASLANEHYQEALAHAKTFLQTFSAQVLNQEILFTQAEELVEVQSRIHAVVNSLDELVNKHGLDQMSPRERFIFHQIDNNPSAKFSKESCDGEFPTIGDYIKYFRKNPSWQSVGFFEGKFKLNLHYGAGFIITHYKIDANDWVQFNDTSCAWGHY